MGRTISKTLASIFEALDMEITGLHIRLKMYRQLFDRGSSRIELLNDSASNFFVDLHRILVDDIILAICRITDPAQTSGRSNMTLEQLETVARSEGELALTSKLRATLVTIHALRKPFLQHRYRRVAHRDMQRFLAPKANPLPNITVPMMITIVESTASCLTVFQEHFNEPVTIRDFIVTPNDADVLVERLKSGAVFDELRRDDPMKWFSIEEQHKFHDAQLAAAPDRARQRLGRVGDWF